jgi:hypothetical protein
MYTLNRSEIEAHIINKRGKNVKKNSMSHGEMVTAKHDSAFYVLFIFFMRTWRSGLKHVGKRTFWKI